MKKLGCTMCILAFSSFSTEIGELKDEKDNVHPGSHPLSSSRLAGIASWLAGVLALGCRKGFTSASMHHFS